MLIWRPGNLLLGAIGIPGPPYGHPENTSIHGNLGRGEARTRSLGVPEKLEDHLGSYGIHGR